jgi:hypothetical protein
MQINAFFSILKIINIKERIFVSERSGMKCRHRRIVEHECQALWCTVLRHPSIKGRAP